MAAAPSQAYCKPVGGNNHCYALVESTHTYEGTWVDILDSAAAIYESQGRMQNETWASFGPDEWVEDGVTLGDVGGPNGPHKHTTSPIWFYAGEYPAGSKNYYEFDYESGPAPGVWFYVQEQDAGNGTWCPWLEGGEQPCVAGRPLYTASEEAGLETAAEVQPYNYGTAYAWGMNLGSGSWSGWASPRGYYSETPEGAKYCTFGVRWNPSSGLADPGGSGDYAAGAAFGIPNGNPSCEGNGGAAMFAGAPPTPFGESLTSASAEGPVPANHAAPTGSALSGSVLAAIATAVARDDGDSAVAPSSIAAVQTTLEKAISAAEPETVMPAEGTEGFNSLLKGAVDFVVLHGHFSAPTAPRPHGEPAPSGTTLELIVDAHTGWVDGFRLGEGQRADLGSLGQAVALN
ncbi:MAG TPA: hypothetical protein VGG08_00245 [Solirubrobacteraceae bacterium]|jgi:hypothetical protein